MLGQISQHPRRLLLNKYKRPGDNPNQCAQGFSCPPPSISIESSSTFPNRYIDVGAGGPAPFTFTATSNASWIQLSPNHGSISPTAPEQRVFVSVKDWSQVPAGKSAATVTFTATPKGQPAMSFPVMVSATKNVVPSGFKGLHWTIQIAAFVVD